MPSEPAPNDAPMPKVDSTLKSEALPTHRLRPLYRVTQIVWYVVGVVEVFLLLRFFMKLLAANPEAGFTKFIYGATWVFAGPFDYVFGAPSVGKGVFEWSTLLAMLVFALFGWLIVKAIVMSRPVSTEEAAKRLPDQEKV